MVANNNNNNKKYVRSMKYPSLRNTFWKYSESWILGKIKDDKTDGLWRVHDGLYDFTEFITKHPGGTDWLILTKGTDITEAFECHHISKLPEQLLHKYFVKKASSKRVSPFTFEENGFYRTLKRRVREHMPHVDKTRISRSKYTLDLLAIATFLLAIVSNTSSNTGLAKCICILLCSFCFTFMAIAAHNFFHQADSWRMWMFNLTGLSAREWRITHGLSHHLFPNTLLDHEISELEPFILHLPSSSKNFICRYLSWLYGFLLFFLFFDYNVLRRVIMFAKKRRSHVAVQDLLIFCLPLTMYLFGSHTILMTIFHWLTIIHIGSFLFALIGITAAHHHPDIYHDGDDLAEDKDWGIHQLHATMERESVSKSDFQALVTFGRHSLHHLFPTIDHAILDQFQPILDQTCREFKTKVRMTTWADLAIGQFKNLSRIDPKKRMEKD